MLPSLSLSSSSSSSATSRVDKATSELLVGPDWTLNIDICDFCNSNHWLAKDVVKEVKRRLLNKNPKVQLLTLTLLETMIKNCGEYIHYHIAERKILDEMIKLVKKKADMHVREKILVLLDSWQEAFGGPGGKYSQYYWACDELRRSGIHFPQRSPRSAPVITPPVTHPSRVTQVGFGMPANSSRRLDEAMSSEVESLSNSTLESMQNAFELLDDMLQAVNPNDRMSVKDEVIVDLVERCRTNQKKLMQMITSTTDEELLAQGLEMNDSLQSVIARHDGIASGAPLPNHKRDVSVQQKESVEESNAKVTEARDKSPVEGSNSPASEAPVSKALAEEEEEEDEFAMLARRHSKAQAAPSHSAGTVSTEDAASSSGSNNALVLFDAPSPATTTTTSSKEQDFIDLLSLVLTTSSTSSETSQAPTSAPAQDTFEASLNSYVVPWAQPQPQPQPQQMTQSSPQLQTHYQSMQSQMPTQSPQGYSQFSSAYPPPPWEATSGYGNGHIPGSNPYQYPTSQGNMNNYSMSMQGGWSSQNAYSQYGNQPMYSNPQAAGNSLPMPGIRSLQHANSFQNPPSMNDNPYTNSQVANNSSSLPMHGARPFQHVNSFPAKVGNGLGMNGNTTVLNNGSVGIPSSGQKPYIPSYRLFEDLNVLGGSESKIKSGPYSSASGTRI
ncbi:TOM1-like protein 6 [Chenopodium quinoa]|uniref:TOM1-like protein 6 n=1 Tax=Chenopodium quinoa TaxID=63459 RepID=UPI000B775603|nr:TOM1-like protein 6 [Chenopodium quinoa]